MRSGAVKQGAVNWNSSRPGPGRRRCRAFVVTGLPSNQHLFQQRLGRLAFTQVLGLKMERAVGCGKPQLAPAVVRQQRGSHQSRKRDVRQRHRCARR